MTPICIKSFVVWGFAPDPTGEAYSAPPDPLAVFRGLFLKGGEVRGLEKKGRKKRNVGAYAIPPMTRHHGNVRIPYTVFRPAVDPVSADGGRRGRAERG